MLPGMGRSPVLRPTVPIRRSDDFLLATLGLRSGIRRGRADGKCKRGAVSTWKKSRFAHHPVPALRCSDCAAGIQAYGWQKPRTSTLRRRASKPLLIRIRGRRNRNVYASGIPLCEMAFRVLDSRSPLHIPPSCRRRVGLLCNLIRIGGRSAGNQRGRCRQVAIFRRDQPVAPQDR